MPPRVDADDGVDAGADDVYHVAADRSAGVHDGVHVVANDGNEADGDIRTSAINCNIIHSVMNASRSISSNVINVICACINIISSMIVNRCSHVSIASYAGFGTTAAVGSGKRRRCLPEDRRVLVYKTYAGLARCALKMVWKTTCSTTTLPLARP